MSADARLQQILLQQLENLRSTNLLRSRRAIRVVDAVHVEVDGKSLVNFASNNYLGLTHHPRVLEAIHAASSAGSGAAGLITGYSDAHASAEVALAQWKGTESAVLLPSGYQANHAVIQTLAALGERAGGARFLIDKLVHASLVDAVRSTALTTGRSTSLTTGRSTSLTTGRSTSLTTGRSTSLTTGRSTALTTGRATGTSFRVFPHNSLAKLRRLLENNEDGGMQVVVTESIFSMDGDAVDLAGLAALKREHPFVLVLDEAHGTGVYGKNGAGLAAELGFQPLVDISIATLSKAVGGVGGCVGASRAFCEALVNFGRAYIFSTSIPSFIATAAKAAIGVMQDEPNRQKRVRELAVRVRTEIADLKFEIPAGDSPILPVILGSEKSAIDAAERLFEEGLLVLPVRPPTVPRGTSRLRVTLSSEHTDDEVDRLLAALKRITRAGDSIR